MKKIVTVTLMFSAIAMMAWWTHPINDETLKEILDIMFNSSISPSRPQPDAAMRFARDNNIPSEQMTRVLEGMVRDGLAVEEKRARGEEPYIYFSDGSLIGSIHHLKDFHGTNTVALLKECITNSHHNVSLYGMLAYVRIEGTNAIPFLREVIGQERVQSSSRRFFYLNVDAAAFRDFMVEMAQTESDPVILKEMDARLLHSSADYPDSPDRTAILARLRQLERPAQPNEE